MSIIYILCGEFLLHIISVYLSYFHIYYSVNYIVYLHIINCSIINGDNRKIYFMKFFTNSGVIKKINKLVVFINFIMFTCHVKYNL